VVPSVEFQYLLVVPGERPGWLSLPEYPCTCPDEIVVEESLVEASRVPLSVNRLQAVSASLDARESVSGLHFIGL
jgi:hypothetical protein